jgi:putative addiction module killer protein
MHMRVVEYIREDQTNPYRQWFDRLDIHAEAQVARARAKLELGLTSGIKWLGGGIGEYVIDWGPGYRIYLAMGGKALIVLFGGGTKQGQQADIDRARALYAEYQERKKAEAIMRKGPTQHPHGRKGR